MTMSFHSCRAAMPDRKMMAHRHEARWKAQSRLVRDKLLQDSLAMFLDLGLTAGEMSRFSGFPPDVIEEGLKWREQMGRTATPSGPTSGWRANLSKNILLAEDDALVATDLACELKARGLAVSGLTRSLAQTLKAVEQRELDFALLNVELQGGLSYPAAKRLRERGIPFAFLTAFEEAEIVAEFRDVPRLSKPQNPQVVAEFVVGLVRVLAQAKPLKFPDGADVSAIQPG